MAAKMVFVFGKLKGTGREETGGKAIFAAKDLFGAFLFLGRRS